MISRLSCIILCTLLGFLGAARGHEVSSVEFEFQGLENQWRLTGQMDLAYMLPETRDLPGLMPLSRTAVMKYSPEEWARARSETEKFLRSVLTVRLNGKDIPWRVEYPDFEKQPFELPKESGDWALMTTRIVMDPVPGPGELRAFWASSEKSELIVTIEEGDDFQVLSATAGSSMLLMNVAAPAVAKGATGIPGPTVKTAERPFAGGLIQTGYHHVLSWSEKPGWRHYIPPGLDHILFMLGLFLLLPKWKPLMWQSLLFTLSHSLTLSLAVMDVVSLPSRLVEILIAASIAWIGIENLFIKKLTRHRYILIFCFGMLHGMGFANGLKEKIGHIPHNQLIVPIFGFNVGVELAQITILTSAFLILWFLRKWTAQVQFYGSIFVGGAGLYWMVERIC